MTGNKVTEAQSRVFRRSIISGLTQGASVMTDRTNANELTRGARGGVRPDTARAVDALYQHPGLPPGISKVQRQARAIAARHGYAPAAAWDDIDDPTAEPKRVVA